MERLSRVQHYKELRDSINKEEDMHKINQEIKEQDDFDDFMTNFSPKVEPTKEVVEEEKNSEPVEKDNVYYSHSSGNTSEQEILSRAREQLGTKNEYDTRVEILKQVHVLPQEDQYEELRELEKLGEMKVSPKDLFDKKEKSSKEFFEEFDTMVLKQKELEQSEERKLIDDESISEDFKEVEKQKENKDSIFKKSNLFEPTSEIETIKDEIPEKEEKKLIKEKKEAKKEPKEEEASFFQKLLSFAIGALVVIVIALIFYIVKVHFLN